MRLCLFLMAALGAAPVVAKTLPDAVDLKAAYCIPVVRAGTELGNSDGLPEPFRTEVREFQEKAQQDLRRLQLYLVPRMELLDSSPLIAAAQGAKDDQARSLAEMQNCMSKPSSELKTCLAVESDAQKRIRSCRDLSFLPF